MLSGLIKWFHNSNRMLHFTLGIPFGFTQDTWNDAFILAVATSGALEFKDKTHGGKWDWVDFTMTFIGVMLGRLIRSFCKF